MFLLETLKEIKVSYSSPFYSACQDHPPLSDRFPPCSALIQILNSNNERRGKRKNIKDDCDMLKEIDFK